MIIELDKSIDKIINTINSENDPCVQKIDRLFAAMMDQIHIVYASMPLLSRIKNCSFFNPKIRKYIDQILIDYYDIYSCLELSSTRTVIYSTKKPSKVNKRFFYIELDSVNLIYRAKFSTENPDDYDFYMKVFKFVSSFDKYFFNIEKTKYSITLENHSFGGSTAYSFIRQMDECGNFVLALADSDKDYHTDRIGQTARAVHRAVNDAQNAVMSGFILNVREKENLVPIDFYAAIAPSSNQNLIKCLKLCETNVELMKYFDLKDGVKKNKVENADQVWLNLYSDFIVLSKKNNVYKEGNDQVIEGINGKLANKAITTLLSKCTLKGFPINTQKKILSIRKDIFLHIPKFIIDEWVLISQMIFDFGCSLTTSHNSFIA